MTYFKSKNIWFWAFIILLIVNISAISTMFYVIHNFHIHEEMEMMTPDNLPENINKNRNSQLQIKLGLSKKEMHEFHDLRMEHVDKMKDNKDEIRTLRLQLFEEISAEKQNKNKIDSIKTQLLKTHSTMIDESISFYNKLIAGRTPKQIERINSVYKRMMMRDGNPERMNNRINRRR